MSNSIDIGIVQMASWGDVIISTLIIKAIRDQHPDWDITYYTSTACAGAVEENPFINKLVTIQATKDQAWGIQDRVIADARRKHEITITPWAGWFQQHDWLPLKKPGWEEDVHHNFMWAYVRSAQLHNLSVQKPISIYLYLKMAEVLRARKLIESLNKSTTKVLIEVEGHSGQSWMRQSWIKPIMSILMDKYHGNVDLLISKGGKITAEIIDAKNAFPGRIHLLNEYSLREVAEIYNACQVFIGCSSGTSNACHAHFCKTDTIWFEAVKSTVWDSRPLRPTGKHIYYGENPEGFYELLRNKL